MRWLKTPLTTLAAALLLAGCASLQQPRTAAPPAVPMPASWSGATAPAAADSLARWWQRFDEPLLPGLIEQALHGGTGNTDVAAAAARLRQARAQHRLAEAGQALAVTAGGSAQASRGDGRPTNRQFGADIDARWEADLWGGTAASVRAAAAGAEAVAAQLGGVQVAVAAEVALNLLQLRGTQARLAIAQQNLDSQRQTLQTVLWRHEAGLVTALDVEQARTAVEQLRAQLPGLQTSAAQAMNALAVLTGRPPGALATALAPRTPAAAPATPPDLALALPAEALRQRPDLRAAERQWQAAAARVDAADAERLPSLTLGGSIGLNALSLGALGGSGVASLLASISVPLFDGGRLQAQVQQQEAARDEAQANYRATLLAALQEVEDTLVGLRGTREQLAAQQAAAAAAQRAAQIAEQRYRSGLVDFPNVLQTQRTLLSAQDGVAATATSLATQHVRLYKALGGGWTPEAVEPAPR